MLPVPQLPRTYKNMNPLAISAQGLMSPNHIGTVLGPFAAARVADWE